MSEALAPTRRVDRGRSHWYMLDGERADAVTDVLSHGIPKPAFITSAAKKTAAYAVDHWDELVFMTPSERLAVLERARYLTLDAAAARGTDVHKLAHRLATGEDVEVPEAIEGYVDAYLAFVDEWAPVELLVETTVGNRTHRYMGTLDFVGRLADGQTWILDFKTTASGIWPESALQLAAYRYAEFALLPDVEMPMPAVDAAGCVWLRADGYDLVPVDASPETFRTFLYAQQVARFVKQPREVTVGDPLPRE